MPVAGKKEKAPTPIQQAVRPGVKVVYREQDSEGRPLPTLLEIREGKAYKRLQKYPDDEDAIDEYKDAFNALQCGQNKQIAVFRCLECGVTQHGRMSSQPCGYCGKTLRRNTPAA